MEQSLDDEKATFVQRPAERNAVAEDEIHCFGMVSYAVSSPETLHLYTADLTLVTLVRFKSLNLFAYTVGVDLIYEIAESWPWPTR